MLTRFSGCIAKQKMISNILRFPEIEKEIGVLNLGIFTGSYILSYTKTLSIAISHSISLSNVPDCAIGMKLQLRQRFAQSLAKFKHSVSC